MSNAPAAPAATQTPKITEKTEWKFDRKLLAITLQTHLINQVNTGMMNKDDAEQVGEVIKSFLFSEEARFLRGTPQITIVQDLSGARLN